MAVDSKAAFQDRARALEVDDPSISLLEASGIVSYATYAYCCTFQPGQSDDTPLTTFLTTALGGAPDPGLAAKLRRLFFEAHALSLEDLKARVDRSETSEARVLPLSEKMERIRLQQGRLSGLSFTPQTEPSHSLIDRVCQQLDDNCVTYVELSKCTSRHDETLNTKVDNSLSLDSSGSLRMTKKPKLEDVNITGEHRLRLAFLRRSLAYDLSGIGTFSVLDIWTQKLFEKMNDPPLSGYRTISVEQVLNADRALWVKVSNDTRSKLHTRAGEPKAFDVSFAKFCEHPEVLQHLAPTQAPSSSRPEASSFVGGKDKPSNASSPIQGKGKGSGKQSQGVPVPDNCEIYFENKTLCKRFQLGRCAAKCKPGKRCMIGYRLCWRKGCHKPHAGKDCPL